MSLTAEFTSISIMKLAPRATLPTRAHADDAGLDLYGLDDAIIAPGEGRLLRTGIACAITPGFVGLIADRSSMAKKGLKVSGGVIDAGYRGEVQVVLWNISKSELKVLSGERIAQMLLIPIATPVVQEVLSLDETTRGGGGFGSTGA